MNTMNRLSIKLFIFLCKLSQQFIFKIQQGAFLDSDLSKHGK